MASPPAVALLKFASLSGIEYVFCSVRATKAYDMKIEATKKITIIKTKFVFSKISSS